MVSEFDSHHGVADSEMAYTSGNYVAYLSDSTNARPLKQKGPPFGGPDVWYPKRDSPL